jgi:hypothetical protein
MAIWTGLKHTSDVLKAANYWQKQCLQNDGSLFTNRNLWTKKNFETLKDLYIDNPILGNQRFYDKLEIQLSGASSEVKQLAAEAVWLMILFVHKAHFGCQTKRDRISRVWGFSGENLPESELLTDKPLSGLANPGTAFLTRLWAEFAFLIRVLLAWKNLKPEEREELSNPEDPWPLCNWVTNFEGGESVGFRHMILYFCYPVFFERICSRNHKKKVVAVFSERFQSAAPTEGEAASLCDIDKSIYEIRELLVEQYDTTEIDFYHAPLVDEWKAAPTPNVDLDNDANDNRTISIPPKFSIADDLNDLFMEEAEVRNIVDIWRTKKNVILQGPPGVGKSYAARLLGYALMEQRDPSRIGFIQFHQSYSYEDFIQGFRPTIEGFALRNGHFFRFCKMAEARPEEPFVFVIDEINRGNLSKIFGELMLLIEADKRGEEWALSLTYSEDGTLFSIPSNVYIIGLMNTADRSLAVVDYALRRRFAFVDLPPQIESVKFGTFLGGRKISTDMVRRIRQKIGALNELIESDTANLGKGFAIGHSFFCAQKSEELSEAEWYRRIIETEILPLLGEYWFDSPDRVAEWHDRLLEGT